VGAPPPTLSAGLLGATRQQAGLPLKIFDQTHSSVVLIKIKELLLPPPPSSSPPQRTPPPPPSSSLLLLLLRGVFLPFTVDSAPLELNKGNRRLHKKRRGLAAACFTVGSYLKVFDTGQVSDLIWMWKLSNHENFGQKDCRSCSWSLLDRCHVSEPNSLWKMIFNVLAVLAVNLKRP